MIWLLLSSTLTTLLGLLIALAMLSNTLRHLRATQVVAAEVTAGEALAAGPRAVPAR